MREDQKTNQDTTVAANIVVADGVGAVNGAAIDMASYRNLEVAVTLLNKGAAGTVDAKLQHSPDNATWTDEDGTTGNSTSITQQTADDEIESLYVVRPQARYYRAVVTAGANALDACALNIAGPKTRIKAES